MWVFHKFDFIRRKQAGTFWHSNLQTITHDKLQGLRISNMFGFRDEAGGEAD